MAVYLDCAATTPVDPLVRDQVLRYLDEEFGNAASRTHSHGQRARSAVEHARGQIAAAVCARRTEVIFTSGATEANNIAILGLAPRGPAHAITTLIEHHAVLEPFNELERRGFEVTRVPPEPGGYVTADAIRAALRPETLLVSVMQVNNETGTIQPVEEIAAALGPHAAYFHVDAAQGFGKVTSPLRSPRIDFISLSGHKIFAPKGIGALIARRRSNSAPPLSPLLFGGGQEHGLRPGTLAVPLVAAFGLAAALAVEREEERNRANTRFREELLAGLKPLHPVFHGDPARSVPHILNLSFPGFDAEEVLDRWQDLVSISNGAACSSQSYTCSHVLSAMQLDEQCKAGALRISWCHTTPTPDFGAMTTALLG
jgi:cysteine desulfurase